MQSHFTYYSTYYLDWKYLLAPSTEVLNRASAQNVIVSTISMSESTCALCSPALNPPMPMTTTFSTIAQ